MHGRTFVDKCFKNKNGQITVFQPPNLPILVWFVCVVLANIITEPTFQKLFEAIGFGSLFTWTYLEIFYGVNYFRRALGLLILMLALVTHLSS